MAYTIASAPPNGRRAKLCRRPGGAGEAAARVFTGFTSARVGDDAFRVCRVGAR
jgi:hypothetical protein